MHTIFVGTIFDGPKGVFSYFTTGITMSQNDKYRRSRPTIALLVLILLLSTFSLLPNNSESLSAQSQACPPNVLDRFGINVHLEDGKQITSYDYGVLNLGWYLDYAYNKRSGNINGVRYAHVIRANFDLSRLEAVVGPVVDANPGALWLVGNEPDRVGQDGDPGFTAEDYATFYHQVYTFLKERDPTAQVAIAGILQPTPLRLKYLDLVLAAYQNQYGTSLPVDVFNTHNFVMSEKVIAEPESDDIIWGAGVPPGFDLQDPLIRYLYPTEAWNFELFKEQLRDLRQWMADNGYRNKPLIVSEYGVLLPDFWDLNGVGSANFMTDSFDFMLSETSSTTGYPADGNRLVQEFSWFSLNYPNFSSGKEKPLAGGAFEYESGEITSLGRAFRDYVANVISECNLQPTATPVPETPTPVLPTATPDPLVETPVSGTPVSETPISEATPTDDPGEPTATNTPLGQTPAQTPVQTPGQTPEATVTTTATPTSSGGTGTANPAPTATPDPTVAAQPGGPTATPLATATPLVEPTPTSGVLTGLAYIDSNGNGIFDANGDIPLANALVTLLNIDVNGLNASYTAVTASNGFYRFVNLPPGRYQLSVVADGYQMSGTVSLEIEMVSGNMAAPGIGLTKRLEVERYFVPFVFN